MGNFRGGGDNATYIVECTRVLGDGVQCPSQGAKGASIDAVAVCCSVNVRSSMVNGGMDHVSRRIEHPVWSAINDLTLVVHKDQVGCLHQREGLAKWVDPKCIWVYGVLHD